VSARFITSPSQLARRPDVIIVGSGIVGLSTAFFLGRCGLRPLVIERLPSPAALTSRRSGEGVRAQWERPENIAIAKAAIELYAGFEGLAGRSSGYRPLGYLYASRSEAGAKLLAARVERQRAAGLHDVEFFDAEAACRRFPLLASNVAGAAFRQRDGIIDVAAVIAGYLAAMDADILLNAEVHDITEGPGGVRVTTRTGEIETGTIVIANGARLVTALRQIGAPFSARVGRSTIIRLCIKGIPADAPVTIDTDLGAFWRPDTGGARITSSFRGYLFVDEGIDDPPLERDYLAAAINSVTPLTPVWRQWAQRVDDLHLRTGTFSVTADGGPVIGPLPQRPHIFLNGGYGGHGVMMSPEGARRLAEMIAAGREPSDNPFSPARFADGRPVRPEPMTINMATQEESA
jgi:sarcosine oxidase subunit beta